MSKQLSELKQCQTASDLANLLGYSYKNFCYILYSVPIHTKYKTITIPKKNSVTGRQILIPSDGLKLLQKKLAALLTNIYLEINQNNTPCSYAFIPDSDKTKFGIVENAKQHLNKKIVLNIDLKDFFTSITFSRIVGFFTKNTNFKLNYDIAITIAQIACYRASKTAQAYLPQGSPCSPIISNFIGQIIDSKITILAKKFHFTYSRYADDLTLSFDKNTVNSKILEFEEATQKYKLGKLLEKEILKTNFQINYKKLCVRTKNERQQVTGLVVNKSINVNKKYYYYTKSMALEYCRNGFFTRSLSHTKKIEQPNFHSLMGYFNHIHYVKKENVKRLQPIQPQVILPELTNNELQRTKKLPKTLNSFEKMMIKAIFHYRFVHSEKVKILCEGKTDPQYLNLYLKNKKNRNFHPTAFSDHLPTFFQNELNIRSGTQNLKRFITIFKDLYIANNEYQLPTIIMVDPDKDGFEVFEHARNKSKTYYEIQTISSIKIAYVFHNLYLISLPQISKIDQQPITAIEDMVDRVLQQQKIGHKTICLKNNCNDLSHKENHYGKVEFFEHFVKTQNNLDFSNFDEVFEIIYRISYVHFFKCFSKTYH